jgi:hypothetical protein
LLDAAEVKTFVVGSKERLVEVVELEGAGTPLRRQMDALWQASDSRSDMTLIAEPSLWNQEFQEVIRRSAPGWWSELSFLQGSDLQGFSWTTTLEPSWYGELRLIGSQLQEAGQRTESMRRIRTGGRLQYGCLRCFGLRNPTLGWVLRMVNRFSTSTCLLKLRPTY